MQHPGIEKTGPVPVQATAKSIPIEQLVQPQKQGQGGAAPNQEAVPGQQPEVKPVQTPPPGGGTGGNDK
jgi:hypothetical protein